MEYLFFRLRIWFLPESSWKFHTYSHYIMHSGSHRLASYIAHVDRKYCSLFADNFWNTIVDQAIISDTGKSLKIYTMYLEICKKQVCFSHIITENCGKFCYESFFDEFSVQSGSWENVSLWFDLVVYLMSLLALMAFINWIFARILYCLHW